MENKSRKVCLIGCGRIANKRHAPLLAGGEIEGAYLGGVCDIGLEKMFPMSKHYKVAGYMDFHKMMRYENPDMVAILTPSGMHGQHIKELLQYGKPIIVEKPLALRLSEAEEVTRLAKEAGIPLFTVLQNRFNPPVVRLKKALDERVLGDIRLANVTVRWCRHPDYYEDWHGTWAMAGGVLANQAIHHIDLMTWMLGEPERVFALDSYTNSQEVEDTLVGVMQYENGLLVTLELTATTRPVDLEGSITIMGTRGTVKIGGFAVNKMEIWNMENSTLEDKAMLLSENPPDVYGFGHKKFYEHVIHCLDNNIPTPIDGVPSIRTVTALYESIEEHIVLRVDSMLSSTRLGVSND